MGHPEGAQARGRDTLFAPNSSTMLLERRTVSRKTPDDGRLEITRSAAEQLEELTLDLEIELHGARVPAALMTMSCNCGKVGQPHEHHMLQSELLRQLEPNSQVDLELDPERRVLRILAVPSDDR